MIMQVMGTAHTVGVVVIVVVAGSIAAGQVVVGRVVGTWVAVTVDAIHRVGITIAIWKAVVAVGVRRVVSIRIVPIRVVPIRVAIVVEVVSVVGSITS